MLAVLLLTRMSTKRRNALKRPAKSEQISALDASESVYCRTCLNTENLMSIFCNSDEEEKVARDYQIVTGLEIKSNDGLSQKMCTKCIDTFNATLQFRRTCKRAEKTLLKMLSSPGKKKKYTDDKPKLKRAKVETSEEESDDLSYPDDVQCDEYFDSKEDVKPILVMKEPEPPSCYTAHQKPMKIPNATSYKCPLCDKEFRMKATYKAHLRFHTSYCVCESCGKRCRNNNQLQEHKRARHGLGKIHKCAFCEYSSATKEALVIHERRHTGERPYICDHCGATFHRRSNLVQHIAIHLPDKNFQCTFCPTREKSKKRLQIHISKTHRVKRYSYKCPRCMKQFRRNEHTHRHLARVHHIPRDLHPPIDKILIDSCHSDTYMTYHDGTMRDVDYPVQV